MLKELRRSVTCNSGTTIGVRRTGSPSVYTNTSLVKGLVKVHQTGFVFKDKSIFFYLVIIKIVRDFSFRSHCFVHNV